WHGQRSGRTPGRPRVLRGGGGRTAAVRVERVCGLRTGGAGLDRLCAAELR
ncbi:MAG: hypothetical protein AVDCRST_MAG07-630, partial [uncultured Frankineae bacterium]